MFRFHDSHDFGHLRRIHYLKDSQSFNLLVDV